MPLSPFVLFLCSFFYSLFLNYQFILPRFRFQMALFTFPNILQNVLDPPSHQILRYMHEALNIGNKEN